MIGLTHYLVVGAILFVAGIFGIFVNRKNVIVILMSIELILLSVNINFVAFSAHLGDLAGQGIMVRDVSTRQSSLEEVFMTLVSEPRQEVTA